MSAREQLHKAKPLAIFKCICYAQKMPSIIQIDEDFFFLSRPHVEVGRKGLSLGRKFECAIKIPGLYFYKGLSVDVSHPMHQYFKENQEGYFRLSPTGQLTAHMPDVKPAMPYFTRPRKEAESLSFKEQSPQRLVTQALKRSDQVAKKDAAKFSINT